MAISSYRAGYQPLKAPSLQLRTYGVAGKWSSEAVRSRGAGSSNSTVSGSDFFLGPQQSGTDWAAAFATASGSTTDAAFQDYVKRNADKFSGGVLEAMLTQADLVDWYKAEQQKKIAETQASIQSSLDSIEDDVGSPLARAVLEGVDITV